MAIDKDLALEHILGTGDEWQSWRALRLSGDDPGTTPELTDQDGEGGFVGPSGRISTGATGEAICHLVILGLDVSGAATVAADWLLASRTPAEAWLDSPENVPGTLDDPAAGRVWATASATCGLLSLDRDPGSRSIDLLRGEADQRGRFTGGVYPTIAAAGAYWLAEGPKTEMAEWALRWTREESNSEAWGPWERATALTFWGAARIPPEHLSVEALGEELRSQASPVGWTDDVELTLRTLEALDHFDL